jgi:hypothetical protein
MIHAMTHSMKTLLKSKIKISEKEKIGRLSKMLLRMKYISLLRGTSPCLTSNEKSKKQISIVLNGLRTTFKKYLVSV